MTTLGWLPNAHQPKVTYPNIPLSLEYQGLPGSTLLCVQRYLWIIKLLLFYVRFILFQVFPEEDIQIKWVHLGSYWNLKSVDTSCLDNDQDYFFVLQHSFEGDERFLKMNTQRCILLFAWSLNKCDVKHWVIIKHSPHNKILLWNVKFCLVIDRALTQPSSLFYKL